MMPQEVHDQTELVPTTGTPGDDPKLASYKVKRNAIFNVLRILIYAPVPLVLTPYIIRHIGAASFGIWAVLYAMASLTSLADFGLVGTLSKHVAEYWAKRDLARLSRLISTGFVLFGAIAILVSVMLAALKDPIFHIVFRHAQVLGPQLTHAYYLLVGVIAFNLLSLPLSSIATGLQRMDITSILASANMGLAAVLSFVFLHAGYGLTGLMAATLLGSMTAFTGYVLLVPILLPSLKIDLSTYSLKEMRGLLAYSSQLYVVQMAVAIQNNIEKLLLSRMVGAVSTGWYELASDVSVKVRSVPGLLLTPLLASAADLHARSDETRLVKLYQRAHKYLAMVGVPIVIWTIAIAPLFVLVWLGPTFKSIIIPIRVLVPVQFINLATGPGTMILFGKGYVRPITRISSIGLVFNLAASGFLIWRFGFAGAFIGTTLTIVFSSVWSFLVFHSYTAYPFWKTIQTAYCKPILCSAIIAVPLSVAFMASASWLALVCSSAIYGLLYLAVLLFSRFFDEFDLNQIPASIRHSAGGKTFLRLITPAPKALELEKSA